MSSMIHSWRLDRFWEEDEEVFVKYSDTDSGPYGKLTEIHRKKVVMVGAAQYGVAPSGGYTIGSPVPYTLYATTWGGSTKAFASEANSGVPTGWMAKETLTGTGDRILGVYEWEIEFTSTSKTVTEGVFPGYGAGE